MKRRVSSSNNARRTATHITTKSMLLLPCLMMYYIFSVLFLLFVWCPCMAINVSVQYNGGLLPGIILLPECYCHRGTRLNAMKRFCFCSLRSHLNVLTFPPLTGGCSESLLPVHSGHQVRWTYQPGSHRRKVPQDFSSTFLLQCVPQFFSREGFSHSFPSSTVKSNFVS